MSKRSKQTAIERSVGGGLPRSLPRHAMTIRQGVQFSRLTNQRHHTRAVALHLQNSLNRERSQHQAEQLYGMIRAAFAFMEKTA